MSRLRSLSVNAINIRIHPHTRERYEALLRNAYELKRSLKARGDQRLMLSSLSRRGVEDDGYIWGTIARFTEIDQDLPWFNSERIDEADDDDLRQINIPENLKPNYKPFFFAFYPTIHMLVFEQYSTDGSVSATAIMKFLNSLLNDAALRQTYGDVAVSLISDRKRLEEIIGIPKLKHLQIVVQKPNPDDLGDYDEEVEQRLLAQHAKQLKVELEAASGQSLTPDESTKRLAEVAMENGRVDARGKDQEGRRIELSSQDFPRAETLRYDPDTSTENQAFFRAAGKFIKKLRQARRNGAQQA